MLEITNLRDGAVLNRNDGIETVQGLEIEVNGIASSQAIVTVNGLPARKIDRLFTSKVLLKNKINKITVVAEDAYGVHTQTITVAYDKHSFKRFNFFIDDCSFFLYHLAKDRPSSIFDEHFLGRLQQIHVKTGAKFTLNWFHHDDHHDFDIADVPDCYSSQFRDNSDWLKFAFHAMQEFPDRPYQNATDATLADDFDSVKAQILRIASEDNYIAPLVIHWAMTNPANFHVLKERGVNLLTGGYIGYQTHIGEQHDVEITDIGYHYEKDICLYLKEKHFFYDRVNDMFLMTNVTCCNLDEKASISQNIQNAVESKLETMSLMSHEQYSYPDYMNYLPDHLDRIELACTLAVEAGYKPVYFAQGLAGNTAWE